MKGQGGLQESTHFQKYILENAITNQTNIFTATNITHYTVNKLTWQIFSRVPFKYYVHGADPQRQI